MGWSRTACLWASGIHSLSNALGRGRGRQGNQTGALVTVVHHNAVEQGWLVCDDAIYSQGDNSFNDVSFFTVQATTVSKQPSSRAAMTSAISWRKSAHKRNTITHTDMAYTELPTRQNRTRRGAQNRCRVAGRGRRQALASSESAASSCPGVNLRSRKMCLTRRSCQSQAIQSSNTAGTTWAAAFPFSSLHSLGECRNGILWSYQGCATVPNDVEIERYGTVGRRCGQMPTNNTTKVIE
jgi:hypothetical protein